MDIKTTATYPYPIWGLPDNYKGDDPAGERKGLKKIPTKMFSSWSMR